MPVSTIKMFVLLLILSIYLSEIYTYIKFAEGNIEKTITNTINIFSVIK